MLNILFGKKKDHSDPIKAITSLKEILSNQEKRELYSVRRINDFKIEARNALKAGNKLKAVALLKKSKRIEKEVEMSSGMKENIEMQIFALEQSTHSISMINAMKMGKAALETSVKLLNPDSVDDLMADLQETVSAASEVSEIMSKPIGGDYEDDDELLAELIGVEQELHQDLSTIPISSSELNHKKETSEDAELSNLMERMIPS
jgi:hypothetical protein